MERKGSKLCEGVCVPVQVWWQWPAGMRAQAGKPWRPLRAHSLLPADPASQHLSPLHWDFDVWRLGVFPGWEWGP